MKRLALTVVLALSLCVAARAESSYAPMSGTFTGGSVALTNLAAPCFISGIYVVGTVSNFSATVVNVTNITHTLFASTITNRLTYEPTNPFPWSRKGVLTLTVTSTNPAQYLIYRKKD